MKDECKTLNPSHERKLQQDNDFVLITEADFYPPSDNRFWKSNVKDIRGGDNFAEYCEEFFKLLDEEEYFE